MNTKILKTIKERKPLTLQEAENIVGGSTAKAIIVCPKCGAPVMRTKYTAHLASHS